MRLLVISLCTQGVMREHFIYYCREFAKNNDLYCITNDNVSNYELDAIETLNVGYTRRNPFGYFSLLKLAKQKSFIDRVNPDIIYIFTHHATSLLIPCFLKGRKVIYQVHDPNPHIGVSKLNAWIISEQLKIYSNKADMLIVAGKALKKQITEKYPSASRKIRVIPFGVLDNYINDSVKQLDKAIDILFFGRIEPYKGIDVLLKAIEMMDSKPQVYIAGGGNIFESYDNINSVPDNVHLTGFLDDSTLISYIKSAKIIVLPYKEASATMTIGQCFYYGKPVVVSDVGTLPEYVGKGGIVFKQGDTKQLADILSRILCDDKKLEELSKEARLEYKRKFTLSNAIKEHQVAFEELMNNEYEDKN